ncbi:MAG: hypothetical protein WCG98_02805 [bacterium]
MMALVGVLSLTASITLSPIVAVLALDHLRILMIFHFLTPLLSATITTDSTFNIGEK